MKSTEHYVESILKIIYKDRMENESRISDWRFLTWSLFRPGGLKLVNCKISLWSLTRKLVQVVGAPDCFQYSEILFEPGFRSLFTRLVGQSLNLIHILGNRKIILDFLLSYKSVSKINKLGTSYSESTHMLSLKLWLQRVLKRHLYIL